MPTEELKRDPLHISGRLGRASHAVRPGARFWRGAIGQRRCLDGVANLRRLKKRTGEGRARALAAGVCFGRKPKLSDFQRKEALSRRGNGETLAQIARSYAVSYDLEVVAEAEMAKKRRLPRVRGLLGPAALRSKRPIRKKSKPEHRKKVRPR